MQIRPLGKNVFIEPDMPEEVSASGIVLPSKENHAPMTGVVFAVGKKVTEVEKGQRVFFPKFGGNEIVIDKRKGLMYLEDDILAILE